MSFLDIFKVKEYEEKIFQLEVENESLKQDLKTQKSQYEFSIRKFKRDLTQRNSTIKAMQPLFEAERINLPGSFENFQLLWIKWGTTIHQSDPQVLRQERACSDILTPLDLDYEHGQGHFRGKEVDYLTSLTSCECVDFQRRIMPCKHMYRLAYEFDVFMLDEVQFNPDIKNLMRIGDIKSRLDSLTSAPKDLLRSVMDSNGCIVENRSSVKTLLANGLIQISANKHHLLDDYKKDDLLSFLPDDAKVPKNTKKGELIELISSNYPDVISNIEKVRVYIELHNSVQHLFFEIRHILSH